MSKKQYVRPDITRKELEKALKEASKTAQAENEALGLKAIIFKDGALYEVQPDGTMNQVKEDDLRDRYKTTND